MQTRMRKFRQTSPERTKIWMEPSPNNSGRKIPVVYYLSRNHHLEHPHFVEVTLSSSEGLYLRDVLNRLIALRGKSMPSKYSWSCKRSYKNGFIWQDLSEDELIVPSNGNEYVLKGSELLDDSPQEKFHHKHLKSQTPMQEPSFRGQGASSSLTNATKKEAKTSQEVELSPQLFSSVSSDINNHIWAVTEHTIYRHDGTSDASTQTDEKGRPSATHETSITGVTTMDGESMDQNIVENYSEKVKNKIFPSSPSSSHSSSPSLSPSPVGNAFVGKTKTLGSLIRAEAGKLPSFKIVEEEEICAIPSNTKLKASNVLMQLLSCGSFAVKDHHSLGLIPTYKPKFSNSKFPSFLSTSMVLGDVNCLSEHSVTVGQRLDENENLNHTFVCKRVPEKREGYTTMKSLHAETSPSDNYKNTSVWSMTRPPRNDKVSSGNIRTISEERGGKKFEGKNNIIQVQERLSSGAWVIIQSKPS